MRKGYAPPLKPSKTNSHTFNKGPIIAITIGNQKASSTVAKIK